MIRKARWCHTGLLCGLLLGVLVHSSRADVQCDGVDDLLNSALTLATFVTPTAYTVTAWILSTGSTFASDLCWGDGPFLMDSFEVLAVGRAGTTGTGAACVYHADSGNQTVLSPLTAGWHHLAARLTAGTLDLVVDGVSVGNVAGVGALSDMGGTLHLCGQVDGQSPDTITDVKVYSTALATAQLERMARSRLREVLLTPAAYWPLTDCADGVSGHAASFKDRSGNSRHLTGAQGANSTGLTCRANGHLSHAWGIQ